MTLIQQIRADEIARRERLLELDKVYFAWQNSLEDACAKNGIALNPIYSSAVAAAAGGNQ
jgi:hypothetical protein